MCSGNVPAALSPTVPTCVVVLMGSFERRQRVVRKRAGKGENLAVICLQNDKIQLPDQIIVF